MRRIIGGVCIASSLLLIMSGCSKEKKEVAAPVKLVKNMVISAPKDYVERSFSGKVYATQEATLSFKVPGKIIQLPVLEGVVVKKGDLIAKLDAHNYEQKVQETKAKYINARAQYQRAESLVGGGHISRSEYDRKRSDFIVATSNYNTAQKNLKEATITAPFAGSISNKYVDNYEYVNAKQDIVKLQDLNVLDIEVSVPEKLVIHLKDDGKEAKIYAIFPSASTKKYPVNFKEFSTEADPETQTYQLKVKLPAPKDISVLPGMTAVVLTQVKNEKRGKEKFFLIPASAVFYGESKQPCVWLIDAKTMKIKKTVVKVDRLMSGDIQVTHGLKPGDRIVTAGVHFLHEGDKVKLVASTQEMAN